MLSVHLSILIRWICNVKAKDEVSSDSLLTKLGIQDLDVVLRTGRMRWFGHVERSTGCEGKCIGSVPNTRRLGTCTRPYSKDGLIITRSLSEHMDSILKNYEVLVLCAPAYRYYDNALIERCHNVNAMACSE